MVTYDGAIGQKKHFSGLSTDTKPITVSDGVSNEVIENGSDFIEMDTGKVFMFDKAGNVWRQI